MKFKNTITSFVISCVLTLSLMQLNFWQLLDKKSFDIASILLPPQIENTDIIIIGIDEASFSELKTAWPWPRQWHAKLLERLQQAGAKVVAFDLILDTPSSYGDSDDMAFAEAIFNFKKVVLGKFKQEQFLAEGYQITSIEPIDLYIESGANTGNVGITPDPDGVIRSFPNIDNPFWLQTLHTASVIPLQHPDFNKIQLTHFYGPAHSFPFVSYYRALNKNLLPDNIFKDKIVLVGLDILAPANVGLQADDRFMTPYSLNSKQNMSGVEFHANLIENAKHGLIITEAGAQLNIIIITLLSLLFAFIFSNWRAFKSSIFLFTSLFLVLLSHWLLFYFSLFIPLFSLLFCVFFCYLSQGAFAYHREYKDKKFITKAFSHYVSHQVLQELTSQPDKLSLGGTRKNVTIMFTDLAGFTEISEQLAPEKVAELLQEHLSRMSTIIVKYGGTLDKYIGDAIMAFWGAPLEDIQQADNALNAAIEMQLECKKIRAEFNLRGMPPIFMRIGLHSGEAIVGNMGSTSLFDYTCIGDAVNLAARLEGINKYYGTNIMLSETTKKQLVHQHHLQLADFVCVKGKSIPIKIYTPCSNKRISEQTLDAFNAYRIQDWSTAKKLLNQLIADYENDPVAIKYLDRISVLEKKPPKPDWNGSHKLTFK